MSTLREQILNLSGTNKTPVLMEGVKYFKFSKRIDKLIYKVAKSKNESEKAKLIDFLTKAKADFVEAESEFASGNEKKGIELYKVAKTKNAVAVKRVMNKEIKSFILRTGIFGGFAAVMFFLTKGAIDMKDSGKLDDLFFHIEDVTKNTLRELNYIGREKDADYFDSKYSAIGKKAAHVTKENMDKIGKEFMEKGPEALEKAKDISKKVGDSLMDSAKEATKTQRVTTSTVSGFVKGLTDAERGQRSR